MQREPRFYFSLQHNQWVLDSDISEMLGNIKVVVKKGFVTDLASVPFFVRPIVNNTGRYNLAATVHDFLYQQKGVLVSGSVFTRKQCDDFFYELMIRDGVSSFTAFAMWLSVRLWVFNFPPFKKW